MRVLIQNFIREMVIQIKVGLINTAPFIVRTYYRCFWKPKNLIEEKLHSVSRNSDKFQFLQIGANDGLINDPIIKFIVRDRWHGLRIEPLPVPFNRLQQLHGSDPNVHVLQGLVAEESGVRTLYYLSFSRSRWATGLATLDRATLQKQIDIGYVENRASKFRETLPKDERSWITARQLNVIAINDLMKKHSPIDLLQIDTEGYDHVLVSALNLDLYLPGMICFEKAHVPNNQLETCLGRLRSFGYELAMSDMDVLAYQTLL